MKRAAGIVGACVWCLSSGVTGCFAVDVPPLETMETTDTSPTGPFETDSSQDDTTATTGSEAILPSNCADEGASLPESYVDVVLEDKPVVYLRLGEPSGSTVAKSEVHDPSYTGTYVSASQPSSVAFGEPGLVVDDPNTAVELKAAGDGVVLGDILHFAGKSAFSIELWLAPSDELLKNGQEEVSIVNKLDSGSGSLVGYDLSIRNEDAGSMLGGSVFPAFSRWSGGQDLTVGVNRLAIGKPNYVAATFDGTTICIAANGGSLNCNPSDPALPSDYKSNLKIGFAGGLSQFAGVIDELAIYDYALPCHRIRAHYLVGAGGQ